MRSPILAFIARFPQQARRFSAAIACAALLLPVIAQAQTVTIPASTSDADWTATKIRGAAIDNFISTEIPAGGNPGAFRQTTMNYVDFIQVAHQRNGFSYDPSVQGAIASIDFSYDMKTIGVPLFVGAQLAYSLLILQDGVNYSSALDASTALDWTPFVHTGFTAANFLSDGGAGVLNPNFSATGGVMQFGYITSNSVGPGGLPPGFFDTTVGGIDNFLITVNQAVVPPPAGAPAGAVAAPVAAPPPVIFVLDLGAIRSVIATGLPMALAQREVLLSSHATATRDVNARLQRLRFRATPTTVALDPVAEGSKNVLSTEGGKLVIPPQAPEESRFELFAAGDFGNQALDEIGSMRGVDSNTWVATAGVEFRASESLALGLAGSYISTDTSIGHDVGDMEISGFSVSGYASWFWRNFYIDGLYSFSDLENEIRRNTLLGRRAKAEPHQYSHRIELNLGYNLQIGGFITGPIVAGEYASGELDGYEERGGGRANLRADGQSYDSLITRLGWQISRPIQTGAGVIVPQARASWDRENLDDSERVSVSLLTSPELIVTQSGARRGEKFTAQADTQTPQRDYLNVGVGLVWEFARNASVYVDYEAHVFRAGSTEQLVSLKTSLRF